MFGEVVGWLAIKISFDDVTSELVFEFGDREMRSFSLTVDFEIPVDVEIDFNIQVTSDIPCKCLLILFCTTCKNFLRINH